MYDLPASTFGMKGQYLQPALSAISQYPQYLRVKNEPCTRFDTADRSGEREHANEGKLCFN